jgi:hypothetical protein
MSNKRRKALLHAGVSIGSDVQVRFLSALAQGHSRGSPALRPGRLWAWPLGLMSRRMETFLTTSAPSALWVLPDEVED